MLSVRNIEVWRGGGPVISDVSFDVAPSTVTALIGANGSGKTSIVEAIFGLIPWHSGTVTFDGVDLWNTVPSTRVRAGMVLVPEGRRLFRSMTVGENVTIAADTAHTPYGDSLDGVLAMFPVIRQRWRSRVEHLSGGEQQMVAIGRALLCRPRLLVLDEPSLGLAPKVIEQMYEALRELANGPMAILLSEQLVEMALRMADFGYVMENGKCVLDGTGVELLNDRAVKTAYL